MQDLGYGKGGIEQTITTATQSGAVGTNSIFSTVELCREK